MHGDDQGLVNHLPVGKEHGRLNGDVLRDPAAVHTLCGHACDAKRPYDAVFARLEDGRRYTLKRGQVAKPGCAEEALEERLLGPCAAGHDDGGPQHSGYNRQSAI